MKGFLLALPVALGIGVLAFVASTRPEPRSLGPVQAREHAIPETIPPSPAKASSVDAGPYYESGLIKARQGDWKGAASDYDRALALRPDWSEAHYNRGLARMILKDYSGALADYDRAILLNKTSPEAYYNRGLVRQQLQDSEGAKRDYAKALEVAPADWNARPIVKQLLGK